MGSSTLQVAGDVPPRDTSRLSFIKACHEGQEWRTACACAKTPTECLLGPLGTELAPSSVWVLTRPLCLWVAAMADDKKDAEITGTVKLISADGHEFVIDRKAAMVSGTIRSMLSGPSTYQAIYLFVLFFSSSV